MTNSNTNTNATCAKTSEEVEEFINAADKILTVATNTVGNGCEDYDAYKARQQKEVLRLCQPELELMRQQDEFRNCRQIPSWAWQATWWA